MSHPLKIVALLFMSVWGTLLSASDVPPPPPLPEWMDGAQNSSTTDVLLKPVSNSPEAAGDIPLRPIADPISTGTGKKRARGEDFPCGKDSEGNKILPCEEGGCEGCPCECPEEVQTPQGPVTIIRKYCTPTQSPCGGTTISNCAKCDFNENGIEEECYQHDLADSDGINKKTSCCPEFKIVKAGTQSDGDVLVALGSAINLEALVTKPQGAGFYNNWPKWEIKEAPDGSTKMPGYTRGQQTYSFTPDLPGSYTVECACLSTVQTIKVKAQKLELVRGGAVVSGTTIDVVVGEKIELTARVTPPPVNPAYLWSLSGNAVYDYDHTNGVVTPLDGHKSEANFKLHYAEGGQDEILVGVLAPSYLNAKVDVNIIEPEIALMINGEGTKITPPVGFHVTDRFGYGDDAGDTGIEITAECRNPAHCGGKMGLIQIVNKLDQEYTAYGWLNFQTLKENALAAR